VASLWWPRRGAFLHLRPAASSIIDDAVGPRTNAPQPRAVGVSAFSWLEGNERDANVVPPFHPRDGPSQPAVSSPRSTPFALTAVTSRRPLPLFPNVCLVRQAHDPSWKRVFSMPFRPEPQSTVLAFTDLARFHCVQLNVLDGVSQSSSASIADRNVSFHFDHWHFGDEVLGVASEWTFRELCRPFLCGKVAEGAPGVVRSRTTAPVVIRRNGTHFYGHHVQRWGFRCRGWW